MKSSWSRADSTAVEPCNCCKWPRNCECALLAVPLTGADGYVFAHSQSGSVLLLKMSERVVGGRVQQNVTDLVGILLGEGGHDIRKLCSLRRNGTHSKLDFHLRTKPQLWVPWPVWMHVEGNRRDSGGHRWSR